MQPFTCTSCRLGSRFRFRQRLVQLQDARRRLSSSRPTPSRSLSTVAGSWYWDTAPPTAQNLAAAEHFFRNHVPTREWTGEQWRKNAPSADLAVPEVIFAGRSNVGKSTLINALTSSQINRVSGTPGATQVMAAWALAAKGARGGALKGWDGDVGTKLTLVDMPGYGFGSRSEWGSDIMTYLHRRKNMRRAFLLVDVLHGLLASDSHMLEIFNKFGIPYQLVATKCERVPSKNPQEEVQSALTRLRAQAGLGGKSALGLGEIIAVGSLTPKKGEEFALSSGAFGVQNLQWAVLKAAGLNEYAMEKALAHRAVKKSASERSGDAGGHDVLELVRGKAPQPTTQTPEQDDRSSLSNLTLQEFMREILGTKDWDKPPAASPPDKARVYDSLDRTAESNASRPQTLLRGEPSPAVQHLLSLATPRGWESEKHRGSRATPPSRASEREAFDHSQQPPLRPRASAVPPKKPPPTLATAAQPLPSGKGVIHGIDAFEEMFKEPPKTRTKQSNAPRQRRRKTPPPGASSSLSSDARNAASKYGKATPPPPPPPALGGKGVTRGIEAFEAMFADPRPQGGAGRSKRRRK